MYTIKENEITTNQWYQDARLFEDFTLYQSLAYQQVRVRREKCLLKKVIIKDLDGCVRLMANVRIYKLPLIPITVGYVQGGPLICHGEKHPEYIKDALCLFRDLMLKEKVSILRCIPYIFDDERGAMYRDIFEKCGFKKNASIPAYHTAVLSLNQSAEQLRSDFQRSWRRCLSKAEKNMLKIEVGSDQSSWEMLKQLYSESKKRKKFVGLDDEVFAETQQYLPEGYKVQIVVVRDEGGMPVCAHSSSHLGKISLGVLAASSEKGLTLNASHLAWWQTLIEAKKNGMVFYDMGGIDPIGNPNVYKFKMRMGATEIKQIGCFDLCAGRYAQVSRNIIDGVKTLKTFISSKKF